MDSNTPSDTPFFFLTAGGHWLVTVAPALASDLGTDHELACLAGNAVTKCATFLEQHPELRADLGQGALAFLVGAVLTHVWQVDPIDPTRTCDPTLGEAVAALLSDLPPMVVSPAALVGCAVELCEGCSAEPQVIGRNVELLVRSAWILSQTMRTNLN